METRVRKVKILGPKPQHQRETKNGTRRIVILGPKPQNQSETKNGTRRIVILGPKPQNQSETKNGNQSETKNGTRRIVILGPKPQNQSETKNGTRRIVILGPKPPQPGNGKENNTGTIVIPRSKQQPGKANGHKTDFFASYKLAQVLGSGGFGTTHLCTEKATGLKYACKVIEKGKLVSQEDMDDLRNEVRIMKHLPLHENIVQFQGAYEDDQRVYLVMELCQGGELFDKIVDRGFYTEADAAVTIKAVGQAIKVCHEHGVMHRDLKPENLLYTSKEKTACLKAIDFGLSTFFHPGQRFHEQVGTFCYMAPEVVLGNYGQEVDIWSAGIILYTLLCGNPPFSYETDFEAEEAIINGVFDYQNGRWSKISEDAKDLVKGMLNRDPRKRLTVKQVLEHAWLEKMEADN